MKTAHQTTGDFPRPGRFSLYICAVVVLCFLNWVALNAQTTRKADNFYSQLVIALADEEEPAIQLQDWMMDFENGYLAENEEPEINVEPWMLSFSHDHVAGTGESEISLEPWMINFEQRCLVVEAEQDFPLECWMVSNCRWECAARMLARR
ncbi:MAG: hypothetical protein AMS23_07365 [Bacteroides sp. SM1_62]|nr:MAG: hypothetical protein AMS26_01600 [Bacteroides sp. SM23_62]KPL22841.1 MAG: hypothetical protein AMS23_07365 [Bacteroides sp. SM1_62]